MRILLINTPAQTDRPVSRSMMGGLGFGTSQAMMLPPIDLALLAAVLRDGHHEVRLLDPDAAGLPRTQALRLAAEFRPDATVASASLPTLDGDATFLAALRETTGSPVYAKIALRDPWFLRTLLKTSGAAAALVGEPDFLIPDILAGRTKEGTAELDADTVTFHPSIRIENLDGLPFAARDLLPHGPYAFPLLGAGLTTMQTSRGCPYPCGFYCPYPLVEGVKWRPMSPTRVVDEIEDFVRRLGITRILFRDATFTLSEERVQSLCDEIRRRSLPVEWWCETRADLLSEPLLESMHAAGCRGINVGVESGDEAVMQSVGKRGLTLETLHRVRGRAGTLGLKLHFLLQVGLPGETRKSALDTLDLIGNLRPDSVGLTYTTPYPGTPMWEQSRAKGWISSTRPEDYDAHTPILRTGTLTHDEIVVSHQAIRCGIALAGEGRTGGTEWRQLRLELLRWALDLPCRKAPSSPPSETRRLMSSGSPTPRISVILPTKNRWNVLRRTLEAYARQTMSPEEFEVVITDDGSKDGTAGRLLALAPYLPFGLVLLQQPGGGPAGARNRALAEARAPIVLMTGDDIVPSESLLIEHLRAHEENPAPSLAILGRVKPPPGTTPSALRSFLDRTDYEFGYAALEMGTPPDYRHFYTCNLSLKTSWLRSVGGSFDEEFDMAAWEDIELGYRLSKAGLTLRYLPSALGIHHHPYSLETLAERMERAGEMAYLLVRKHPELDGPLAPVNAALSSPRGRDGLRRLLHKARLKTLLLRLCFQTHASTLDNTYHALLNEAFRTGVRKRSHRAQERIHALLGLSP